MKYLIALLITCSSLCQVVASTQTTPFLTQDQLVEILVDLELTQVMIHQDIPHDPQLAQMVFQEQVDLIFNAHGTNRTLFQQSYFHYLTNPKQFKLLQEQLIAHLEKLLQEAAEKR